MTMHTPGPWEVKPVEYDCEPYLRIRGTQLGYRFKICNVHREPGDGVEAIANARLIAAAPDLLAALEALVDVLGNARTHPPDRNCHELWDAAEAAIAKAKRAAVEASDG